MTGSAQRSRLAGVDRVWANTWRAFFGLRPRPYLRRDAQADLTFALAAERLSGSMKLARGHAPEVSEAEARRIIAGMSEDAFYYN